MWQTIPPIIRLALLGASALGIHKGYKHLFKKKLFISFAIEDVHLRNLLVGQSQNDSTPFKFIDMSVKTPWDKNWKDKCRERIKGCHGVLVLISKNTYEADGVHWEIQCAQEEGLKIMVMKTNGAEKLKSVPKILKNHKINKWSWPNIETFVQSL